jgi:hypothetical protein
MECADMEALQFSISNEKGKIRISRSFNQTESTSEVGSSFYTSEGGVTQAADAESAKMIAVLQVKQTVYECAQEFQERIKEMLDPTSGMSDEEKEAYDKRVLAKVYSGKELTPEELRYIRLHYPALYPQVLRVQMQRKSLEEQLKHCQSKQQAQDLYDSAMLHVSDKDPMAQVLYAAYNDVYEEFKESDDYKSLPEKTKEEEEEEGKEKAVLTALIHTDNHLEQATDLVF